MEPELMHFVASTTRKVGAAIKKGQLKVDSKGVVWLVRKDRKPVRLKLRTMPAAGSMRPKQLTFDMSG